MIEIEQFAHNPWFNDHFAVLFPFLSKIISNLITEYIKNFKFSWPPISTQKNTTIYKYSLAPSSGIFTMPTTSSSGAFTQRFSQLKRPFWETIWVSSLSSLTPRPRISSTVSSSERALSISSRSSRSSSLSSGSFLRSKFHHFELTKNNQVRTSRWKDELSSVKAMRKWHWVASVIFQFKSDNSYELNR